MRKRWIISSVVSLTITSIAILALCGGLASGDSGGVIDDKKGGNQVAVNVRPFDVILNTSEDWRAIWAAMFNGVGNRGPFFAYENELEVTAPGGMAVQVDTGAAMLNGVWFNSDAATTLPIDAAPLLGSGDNRIDVVVARVTYATKTGELAVLKGTAAPAPTAPSLTQNTVTYEIPLAEVYVGEGVAAITSGDITDAREFCLYFANNREFDAVVAPTGGDFTTLRDAVASGAETIWIAKGTYSEGAGNITLSDNTTIMGAGRDVVTVQFTDGGVVTGDNCHVEEIGISASIVSSNYAVVTGADTVVQGCRFTGSRRGLSLGARSVARGNVFDAVNEVGIFIAADDVLVQDNVLTTITRGIYASNVRRGAIVNNAIDTVTDGIYVDLTAGYSDYWTITGNHIITAEAYGIYFDGGVSVIAGNVIKSACLSLLVDGAYNSISHNTINETFVAGVLNKYGLAVDGEYNTITGNNVTQKIKGIIILTGSDYNTVTANVAFDNTTANLEIEAASCDGNIVVANICTTVVDNGTGSVVANNN